MSEHQIDAVVEDVRTRLGALELTLRGLGAVQSSAQSPDGAVVAWVDGNGALARLQLAESVSRRDAADLAATILATTHEAARRAAGERARLLEELRGALR
ncbi:YbaB/EbfC family nucleoid-associated protein [Rhodococcus chondri]|uniref:YbaB/EbfC family nucleoid-associated protein n=1 Tax=Rhodococcus chondri TaxID=3065941 RepID=A0ABU7JZE0_9NOCA|nr:YbaB/EbfC family nucleoid-associated protein [Rhodococcus sp. CC-R104]MEE2035383.1 YbaB/EbfC family nucleoid-associated protein [Rhodococcus sp. CC-R104]